MEYGIFGLMVVGLWGIVLVSGVYLFGYFGISCNIYCDESC